MDATCDYSMMMEMKHDTGEPMFNSISVTLMCDKCRKANLLECPHMEHEIPHWKRDKKRSRLVQSIMQNDKAMYLRENAGVVSKSDNHAFHLGSIDTFLNTTYDVRCLGNLRAPVFVCIDTAGGGSSCTAICSGIYTKSHSLLVRILHVDITRRHRGNEGSDGQIFRICVTLAFRPRVPMSTAKKNVQMFFQISVPRVKLMRRTDARVVLS